MSAAVDGTGSTLAAVRALREGLRLVEAGYYLTPVTIKRNEKGKKHAKFHAQWKRDTSAITLDPDVIRDWSAQHACSFAVVCGPSGVEGVDLDVDPGRDVDAISWWSMESMPLGQLVVETPSGGLHTYWRRRSTRTLPTSASEVAPGVDTRSVGGVFFAPGAFVLGMDGEPESTAYNIQGELPRAVDLSPTPDAVLDAWAVRRNEPSSIKSAGDVDWDDGRPRYYTMEQARAIIQEHGTGPLREAKEGHRNDALNIAALVVGHFVPAFFEEDRAVEQLRKLAREAGLDEHEIGPTIRSGLTKGMERPYIQIVGDALDDIPPGRDPDAEFKRELERERIRRRVRDELASENREPLRVLSFEDFLDAPMPDYLVPRMFYRDGLSVVFGAPGAAKSFLVLDIALCLASGKPWRGRSLGRGRVHYIMAEGQATNTLRTRAWLHYHEVARADVGANFTVVPTPVLLTDAGVADYLPLVERDQPDMIILDTKNLMFAGKESQGDDYGQMLRVLHRIRETAGGAAVILVDHSGLGDDSRTRGSNAQKGGVETEIRVTNENNFRKAEVTRDKSGADGTEWLFRLESIVGLQALPVDVDAPAVVIPLGKDEVSVRSEVEFRTNWFDTLPRNELPERVEVMTDKPGDAACDIFRLMVHLKRAPLTAADVRGYVAESPRTYAKTTIHRALLNLKEAGVVTAGSKANSFVLTTAYAEWE